MGIQQRMVHCFAGLVVVKIAHMHALGEQAQQGWPVAPHGHIAHQHLIARLGLHVLEQLNIPLQTRHQPGSLGLVQTPLNNGTQAVGIAVANIKVRDQGHVVMVLINQKLMGKRMVSETSGVSRVSPAPTETLRDVVLLSR